ncbi:MAG: hypothetical protein ACE5FZ_07205 [Nitrospiria bacterium]
MDYLYSLQGKNVSLVYNGIVYKGKLVGAGEDEIHLQTLNDWLTLPMDNISDLHEAPDGEV